MQAHAGEMEKARQQVQTLAKAGADSQKRIEAYKELQTMSKPITDIFGELRARLDSIPTEAQKASNKKLVADRVAEQRVRMKERMDKRRKAGKSTASAPANSRPAKAAAAPREAAAKPKPATVSTAVKPSDTSKSP